MEELALDSLNQSQSEQKERGCVGCTAAFAGAVHVLSAFPDSLRVTCPSEFNEASVSLVAGWLLTLKPLIPDHRPARGHMICSNHSDRLTGL